MNFEKQNAMAEEILTNHRNQVLAIVKATRAGATTSLLKKACELGQKTVIVAPYIKIFDMTVKDVGNLIEGVKPRIARIPANKDICERIKAKINNYPSLDKLAFLFQPSCENCDLVHDCELQNILNSDWDVLGLTYAKLQALSVSESKASSDIFQKLKLADNLILDEFVTGIIATAPSVEIQDPHSYLESEFDYSNRMLDKMFQKTIETVFWGGVGEFAIVAKSKSEGLNEGAHKIFENSLRNEYGSFFEENFSKCWRLVEQLTIEGKDTNLLQQIVQIFTSNRFLVSKRKGKVSIRPCKELNDLARGSRYLRDFVANYLSKDKLVSLVDACLPDLELSETFGILVEPFDWGDPLETNQSQLIICDTRKISDTDFFKEARTLQPILKEFINEVGYLHKPNAILIVTLNKDMSSAVKAWAKKGEISKEIEITYYRSDVSRGIEIDPNRRILILIGAPYLPNIAYLAETMSPTGEASPMQTVFKKSDMRSAFINMIGRVKDPKGLQNSIVYARGITFKEVRSLVAQEGIRPPWIVRFPVRGADAKDFTKVADLFLRTPREKWLNLEEDLPILARIIRKTLEEGKIQCGQIIANKTEQVQEIACNYRDVLKGHGIELIKTSRGYRLESSKS